MSHFTTIKSSIKDVKELVNALCDMGFEESQIEVSNVNELNLIGYDNTPRIINGQTAKGAVRVHRKFVGASSNDIGFIKEADGTYTAVISEYDSSRFNSRWLGKLNQNYVVRKTKKQLTKQGYRVKMVVKEDNTIQLRATL